MDPLNEHKAISEQAAKSDKKKNDMTKINDSCIPVYRKHQHTAEPQVEYCLYGASLS
jgi:hypothetical protein